MGSSPEMIWIMKHRAVEAIICWAGQEENSSRSLRLRFFAWRHGVPWSQEGTYAGSVPVALMNWSDFRSDMAHINSLFTNIALICLASELLKVSLCYGRRSSHCFNGMCCPRAGRCFFFNRASGATWDVHSSRGSVHDVILSLWS